MANEPVTLSLETRRWLVGLARHAISSAVAGELTPKPESIPVEAEVTRGCFVSLHTLVGELRGCIGTFEDTMPLWRSIIEMAVAAATRDPRFRPVSVPELASCVVEISALTPRQKATPEQVTVGVHGLWISRGFARGVLLPQVATQYGWDRETFLEHTCVKAGLPRQAWREPDTTIELFLAEVFGEEH